MLHIHCTRKLMKALAPNGHTVVDVWGKIPTLQEWYDNLFRLERRQCVLFTHATTLFSFFVPGLTRPDFVAFTATFRQHLRAALAGEGMDTALAERIAPAGVPARIVKTESRSVLGSMNELVFQIRVRVERAGGLAASDHADLNHALNQTLMGAIDYARPAEAFEELVDSL